MSKKHTLVCLGIALCFFVQGASSWAQGVALRGVSPINEGMAGCATACPIDSAGALHWNPATISGLPSSDMSWGCGMILPETALESSCTYAVPDGGGGTIHVPRSGRDESESGAIPAPTMAMVFQEQDSPWTFGFGLAAIGGAQVNYPASTLTGGLPDNPILGPNTLGGIGRLSAKVEVFQMTPTASYALNERVAVGFSPTITLGRLIAEPLFLGPGEVIGGDPMNVYYSPGTGTRYTWGGGFQCGVYINGEHDLHYGFSIKSPQWVEPFRFHMQTQAGEPTVVEYDLDFPLILSWGVAYDGIEDHIFAMDIRYFDYAGTPGFDDSGYDPVDRHVLGLGWDSIMSVALGVQRRWNDRLTTRMGYCFNENPIPSESAMYNVASPLITMHSLHLGASLTFAENWVASLAYIHCFENSVEGPMYKPIGGTMEIPGSSVRSIVSANTLQFGFSKRF